MLLQGLQVTNFRCIEKAVLDLDPRCTLITGENATGKTSLLEAIHVLSFGRSFRTGQIDHIVRQGEREFVLTAQLSTPDRVIPVGMRGSRDSTELRVNGAAAKGFADVASLLPVQIIDPEVHRLLEGGPKERRQFLDWGVFHVEPRLLSAWRRYQRSLRQRNASLKAKPVRELVTLWDEELAAAGEEVSVYRAKYLSELAPVVVQVTGELLDLAVNVSLRRGWSEELTLAEALLDSWNRDTRIQTTTVGPHRAELAIQVDGAFAKDRISRGQQKLLSSGMILGQLIHRARMRGDLACLLLDDPAAELDVDNLQRLLHQIEKTPAQLVVTALDSSSLNGQFAGKRFHVKHGHVSAVL